MSGPNRLTPHALPLSRLRIARIVRIAALFIACAFASTALGGIREDVERLVRSAPLKNATVGVSIRDTVTNAALVSINADTLMTPASNMKVLTSGAALHVLGPNYEFTTRMLRDGERLIIVGDGDPALGDPELLKHTMVNGRAGIDIETLIQQWIKPVVDAGITKVSEVVVDDRIFDRQFTHPTWPADQLNNAYCAQVSGLNFHTNVLYFFPRPRPGQSPEIGNSVPGASWLKITNLATSKSGPKNDTNVWISRKTGSNDLTFRGNVKVPIKVGVPVTVDNIPELFAHMIADRLRHAGVNVGGHRVADKDDPINKGEQVGPAITTPISTVITRCNRDSENLYAESLLKRLGHAMTGEPGSWTNGSAIVRHVMHERLNDPMLAQQVIIADGSGLSSSDRIAPATMTAWLNSLANDEKISPVFLDSLATAGVSGTLEKRMASTKKYGAVVQAKTGYINQVSCLSGYVTMPNGRRRSFCVMVNGLKEPVSQAKALQDQIVAAIAEDMTQAQAAVPVQLGSD